MKRIFKMKYIKQNGCTKNNQSHTNTTANPFQVIRIFNQFIIPDLSASTDSKI
jgi:hypothetical protein